jgi:hypothetical protein
MVLIAELSRLSAAFSSRSMLPVGPYIAPVKAESAVSSAVYALPEFIGGISVLKKTRPLSGELLAAKLEARRGTDCDFLFKRFDCS